MPDPFSSPNDTIINSKIPVFAPKRVQAVTLNVAWTPTPGDKVFVATVECNAKISGGTPFPLEAYVPLGIWAGLTYTFSVSQSILVM